MGHVRRSSISLQWGRDREVADRPGVAPGVLEFAPGFNGAATVRSRIVDEAAIDTALQAASMGPRP